MRDEILYRYFNNEATPEEVRQIEDWLKTDPGHQREFDAAHMLFNATVMQQARYEAPAARAKTRLWTIRRAGRAVMRAAAAVAMMVGAAYAGGWIGQGRLLREMSSRTNVLEVPAGQRITMTLEDGTTVCLNSGSRLEYPSIFAKDERHIKLSGEALFDVTHRADQPFIVETFASEIEVLGTQFNVFADDEHNRFSATLVDGRIRATSLVGDRREQVVLHPDEMIRLVDGRLVMSRVSDPDALCWTEGYINIRDVGFDELMQRFENAYDVTIVIDRRTLPEIGYASGKIRISEGVDFALHLLQHACDFTYTKDPESNTITIR